MVLDSGSFHFIDGGSVYKGSNGDCCSSCLHLLVLLVVSSSLLFLIQGTGYILCYWLVVEVGNNGCGIFR